MKNTSVQLNENQRLAIDTYNYMLEEYDPVTNEWMTLWYYSDLKDAWERILKDQIRIDGGHRIEDLIELLTAQDAGNDEICAELESEFPELFGRRFPTDSVLGHNQRTKETLRQWAGESSREGWPRG